MQQESWLLRAQRSISSEDGSCMWVRRRGNQCAKRKPDHAMSDDSKSGAPKVPGYRAVQRSIFGTPRYFRGRGFLVRGETSSHIKHMKDRAH